MILFSAAANEERAGVEGLTRMSRLVGAQLSERALRRPGDLIMSDPISTLY